MIENQKLCFLYLLSLSVILGIAVIILMLGIFLDYNCIYKKLTSECFNSKHISDGFILFFLLIFLLIFLSSFLVMSYKITSHPYKTLKMVIVNIIYFTITFIICYIFSYLKNTYEKITEDNIFRIIIVKYIISTIYIGVFISIGFNYIIFHSIMYCYDNNEIDIEDIDIDIDDDDVSCISTPENIIV